MADCLDWFSETDCGCILVVTVFVGRGVDAKHLAGRNVDQWTARVATVDRGVSLDQMRGIEIETDLLLILMDRIVSEANRLLEIRSLVEDGIKKSQDVISRLEQGSLSMDFCRSYLKKFLETGTLSKADLLDFYSGKDLKIKYQAIHEDIVTLGQ